MKYEALPEKASREKFKIDRLKPQVARFINLRAKMQNLLDWVSDKTRRRRSKYWVGGNDIEVEGAWEWEGTRAKVS